MAETFPTRREIASRQLEILRPLCDQLRASNPFYQKKLAGTKGSFATLEEFSHVVPFTTKSDIAADQQSAPPYGTNLTFPLERYTRCHQTSGTAGVPLRWLDTPESWDWMIGNWRRIHSVAGVETADRVFFAFSFGPFIGFWLAFEAAAKIGCLCLPGGGMNTVARLRQIVDLSATVLCCTPTYAIHLGNTALKEKIDLSKSAVRVIIVAGEPGGSVPAIRSQIEQLWPGARVFDHHGMTEVGPVTYECPARPGVLHVMEEAYLPEIIAPGSGTPVNPGQEGELVLTTLGRTGSPLLRYRTGDLVRASEKWVCICGRSDLALPGGILGRSDDMVVVRGVNVYPSAVDAIVRNCGGIAEYRVQVDERGALTELQVEIEPEAGVENPASLTQKLEAAFHEALALRVPVRLTSGLPRFEMKAKRWIRQGATSSEIPQG
jgi:phenylacetate-CoA ligase